MLLFFSSIILVLLSSFFIANVFDSKNIVNYIIYFLLTAFANVVITFEILSLFNAINEQNVIVLNIVFALISMIFWVLNKCPVLIPDFKNIFTKFYNALKLDKTLLVLSIGFLFACIISLILISFLPAIDIDTTTYHVVRSLFWIDNGTVNHFPAPDARMIMFPINSELLYTWFFIFLKKDLWLGVFNFCGVILFVTSLYGLMSEITYSLRKKLWVILVSISFPFVLVRFTGVETSLLLTALVITSVYLYMQFLKNKKLSICFMSSLALSLAVGTKTSVLFMLPGLVLWFIWYSWITLKKEFYKPFFYYCLFFVITFILFASYNYVLNFINYGNFLSAENIALAHSNIDGILSVLPNLYRYFYNFFIMPEFIWSAKLSSSILILRDSILDFFNADIGMGFTNVLYRYVSHTVSTADGAFGIEGPILVLPLLIFSLYKSFVSKNKKTIVAISFVYVFLMSLLLMAFKLAFMSYNIRFFMTFAMLTVPILIFSYKKGYNFYKILLVIISLIYMFYIPSNVSLYPVKLIIKWAKAGASLQELRDVTECSFFTENVDVKNYRTRDIACLVRKKIKKYDNRNKILFFPKSGDSLMPIKKLMFDGYKIDINLSANVDNINFNDYNIIITCNETQKMTTILNLKPLDEHGYNQKNGILCHYFDGTDNIITHYDGTMPAKCICYFNDEFRRVYSLKLLKQYRFQYNRDDPSNRIKNYNFYENMNNPLIK